MSNPDGMERWSKPDEAVRAALDPHSLGGSPAFRIGRDVRGILFDSRARRDFGSVCAGCQYIDALYCTYGHGCRADAVQSSRVVARPPSAPVTPLSARFALGCARDSPRVRGCGAVRRRTELPKTGGGAVGRTDPVGNVETEPQSRQLRIPTALCSTSIPATKITWIVVYGQH